MTYGTEAAKGKDELSEKLGAGTTSAKKGSETSKDKGKLFTQEAITKLISDAKAEEGRRWKQVELQRDQLKTDVGNLTTRLDEISQTVRAKAYEEAKGSENPQALTLFNRESEVADRERKVQAKENDATREAAQLKADREAFETESGATMITVIAAKHNLEPSRLEALGITDKVALEKVAAEIASAGKPAETEEEKTAREAKETEEGVFQPASDLSSAGKSIKLDVESVEKGNMESIEAVLAPKVK